MSRSLFPIRFRAAFFVAILVGMAGQGAAWAAGFSANINFQPTNAATVAGYLPDVGYAFGDRDNGYAYGWNVANTTNAFQRNQPGDGLVNAGNKMQPSGQSLSWQIAVPDGCFDVLLVAADPSDTGGKAGCPGTS